MKMTMDIANARELDEMLKQLPPAVSRRAAGNALRAGGRVIRDEARIKARVGAKPGGTGQLARAIKVVTVKSTAPNRRRVLVIVTNKDAGINPHWIEYGTVANRIRKKSGGSTGGIKARAFMRPAADAKFRQAVDAIGASLGEAIVKEATKLGGRAQTGRR